ncbi:hypothetical protein Ddye_012096 [Dipteronia dyeriana]|uniref:Zinc transporter 5 n=1 Tax=Dipteronia dyeriana TaxID=168575 RepID=A0AAE0CI65_9ROSI|nr:hypothetical protein Ddye_012096 [Dipteronia dyeriana]
MMSPRQISEDRGGSPHFRQTPLQIIHVIGNFLRIWSVYSMYRYLSQTGASVTLFIFCCLVPSSILFLLLQKPWKGRALSNQQVVPSVINGVITALYFILWGKGLKSCGPVRAILAEYSGAVLGVLSAVLYGRRGLVWKKVGGLIAMLASFYFLSQGWAMASLSPISFKDSLDTEVQTEHVLGMKDMAIPIFAGILSALRRVIARRVSLKNQLKRRLHAITIASATCFLFPVAMWDLIIVSFMMSFSVKCNFSIFIKYCYYFSWGVGLINICFTLLPVFIGVLQGSSGSSVVLPFSAWAFLSTTLFGIFLIFFIDNIAEERLHMVFSSPRHLLVAGGCIIVMEIVYRMDFSLPGFVICSLLLGFGIYEATSLELTRKDSLQKPDQSNGMLEDELQMSSLPT